MPHAGRLVVIDTDQADARQLDLLSRIQISPLFNDGVFNASPQKSWIPSPGEVKLTASDNLLQSPGYLAWLFGTLCKKRQLLTLASLSPNADRFVLIDQDAPRLPVRKQILDLSAIRNSTQAWMAIERQLRIDEIDAIAPRNKCYGPYYS